jgi:DNA-binding transcriptional LysR family regulator/ribosomal protein S18 acetylase RimI-like enzyme
VFSDARRVESGASEAMPGDAAAQKVWSLDLRALHVFVTIASAHSFRRAADRLHISPASTSQAIAKLERHVGCRLFDRSTRYVDVTAAGRALLPQARSVLDAATSLQHSARSFNGQPTLRVGVMHGMHADLIVRAATTDDAPAVLLSDVGWDDPTCGLDSSLVDLAILVGPTDYDGDFVRLRVTTEPVIALLPPSFAGRATVGIDELDALGWARVHMSDTHARAFWRLDDVRGGPPSAPCGAVVGPTDPTRHRSPSSLLFAVRRGEGAHTTVPAFGDHINLDAVASVPVRGVPPAQIHVAYRRTGGSPAIERFARRIVDAVGRAPQDDGASVTLASVSATGGSEMHVRTARPSDAAAMGALVVRAWQAAYRGLMPDDYLDGLKAADRTAQWTRFLTDELDPPRAVYVAADDDGRVLGFVAVGDEMGVVDAPRGQVYAINVDPDQWGSGVGRALLDAACDRLRTSGFSSAVLWVHPGNARACRFYRAAGWRPDGTEVRADALGVEVTEARYHCSL